MQAEFAQIAEVLRSQEGVSLGKPSCNTFGRMHLLVDGKIFAMITAAGHLVVKLPEDRIENLLAHGLGRQGRSGRNMQDWLSVDAKWRMKWPALAREALDFVRSQI